MVINNNKHKKEKQMIQTKVEAIPNAYGRFDAVVNIEDGATKRIIVDKGVRKIGFKKHKDALTRAKWNLKEMIV